MTRVQPHPHDARAKLQFREDLERDIARRLQEELDELEWALADRRGRALIFRVLDRSGLIFSDAMEDDPLFNPTVSIMHRDIGRRQVGWRMDHLIRRHFPDQWQRMIDEHMGKNHDD